MPSRSNGDKDSISSTFMGVCAAYILTAILSISFSTPVSALRTVPGSPCEQTCTANNLNFANNTVCLDDAYQSGSGQQFRECTTCLLNSTAVDKAANVSDVYWGLFNLRYTLSECMFAYPAEIVSVSSPCQVTCQPLNGSIEHGIGTDVATATDNTVPNLDYCNGFGGTYKINNCTFCYSFIPQQLFMANFMQALHIACRQPPALGATFYPDGRAIFNESAIPGPGPQNSGTPASSGLTGWKLGLVIALPVVGGTLLFGAGCFCCFKFTKKRRQRMAATGRMSMFHERHPGGGSTYTSPISTRTPPSQYQWPIVHEEPDREMQSITYAHTPKSAKHSPGLAQGRWSHHADDEDVAPLSAAPRDDVGPGEGQAKDPFLHEQYFGIASSGVPSDITPGPNGYIHPDERGSWVRP